MSNEGSDPFPRLLADGETPRTPLRMKRGFDFTAHIEAVCRDVTARLPAMRHIDMTRVSVTFSQARKRVAHGLYATLTPLRFEGGAREGLRNGRRYGVERVLDESGREMLYILSFYLPRFMDVSFREKMITIFHELWHISPEFNGDLRRFPGRCYAHSHSQEEYDAEMARLVDRYLARGAPVALFAFLHCNFEQLQQKFGSVYGTKLRQPRLIPKAS